jgi:hypothetical protein
MRFWVNVSAICLVGAPLSRPQNSSHQTRKVADRNYEWKLAGLLPGHTSLGRAEAILGQPTELEERGDAALWRTCGGDELAVNLDTKKIVQAVRAMSSDVQPQQVVDCAGAVRSKSKWVTGLGLRLGDASTRVTQIYGKPDSTSPSTKGGQQLELLYYAFDWAGPDVPQVMEVLCTPEKDGKPGQVVEITLAAPSL